MVFLNEFFEKVDFEEKKSDNKNMGENFQDFSWIQDFEADIP